MKGAVGITRMVVTARIPLFFTLRATRLMRGPITRRSRSAPSQRPVAAPPVADEVPPATLPLGLKAAEPAPGREAPAVQAEVEPEIEPSVETEPEGRPVVADGGGPEEPSEEIASVTLAELYFNQGFPDKAETLLRQLLAREPGNERARARLQEIEAREARVQAEARQVAAVVGPGADAKAVRRQAIVRAIAELEKLLAAIRKG